MSKLNRLLKKYRNRLSRMPRDPWSRICDKIKRIKILKKSKYYQLFTSQNGKNSLLFCFQLYPEGNFPQDAQGLRNLI